MCIRVARKEELMEEHELQRLRYSPIPPPVSLSSRPSIRLSLSPFVHSPTHLSVSPSVSPSPNVVCFFASAHTSHTRLFACLASTPIGMCKCMHCCKHGQLCMGCIAHRAALAYERKRNDLLEEGQLRQANEPHSSSILVYSLNGLDCGLLEDGQHTFSRRSVGDVGAASVLVDGVGKSRRRRERPTYGHAEGCRGGQ